MKLHLHFQDSSPKHVPGLFKNNSNKACYYLFFMFMMLQAFTTQNYAQGTWTAMTNLSPNPNGGVMLVLSDGTVMCKTTAGGGDGVGNTWDRLVPSLASSYASGTWTTTIAPMHNTRLYFSSQVLKDARVYVAGGEYGTGGSAGEIYNSVSNKWTDAPSPGVRISDANSEILESGKVLQALVSGTLRDTKFWNPGTNTYSAGPSCLGIHNESAWVKLGDNSILMVDRNTTNSERYIPSLNAWVADANVPVSLYDPYGLESGGAVLLPNGKAFFIGSLGHCAIYTPSGSSSPGSWVAAANIPNGQGTPDAPAAMEIDGKVLLATSPIPTSGNHFPSPTSFYEYNYLTNSFIQVNSPEGGLTINIPCYEVNFTVIPNGRILYSRQSSSQYYVYSAAGSALAAATPTITSVSFFSGVTYTITGTKFNGISEGASYGDDWQMNTNYPLVRLYNGTNGNFYYARTHNWNSTGVRRGARSDSAQFDLPAGLPFGNYSLYVVVNGIPSAPFTFEFGPESQIITQNTGIKSDNMVAGNISRSSIYPNPASNETTIQFTLAKTTRVSLKVFDMKGRSINEIFNGIMKSGEHSVKLNVDEFPKGVYFVRMTTENGTENLKLIVQ